MTPAVRHVVDAFDWFVLVYFLLLNSGYLLLIAIASVDVARWMRRLGFAGHDDIFVNPLTPACPCSCPRSTKSSRSWRARTRCSP